eukprot:11089-Pelagomonas_calceolata.AAC.2
MGSMHAVVCMPSNSIALAGGQPAGNSGKLSLMSSMHAGGNRPLSAPFTVLAGGQPTGSLSMLSALDE